MEARPLAGGTDLLIALRRESSSLPALHLIDLSRLPDLATIAGASPGGVTIGARATHAALAADATVRSAAPLLATAAAAVGSPQIRNLGTLGGNLCTAAPCADTLPPLLALEAILEVQATSGQRCIPVQDLVQGPYETSLRPDELLIRISCPALPPCSGSAFIKLGRRRALSISRGSLAVVLTADDAGRLRRVRLAAGSVLATPCRFEAVEQQLLGATLQERTIAGAAELFAQEMVRRGGRRWSTPYKEAALPALVRRALRAAWRRMAPDGD